MSCKCGDSRCPSCGSAQGTLDLDQRVVNVLSDGFAYRPGQVLGELLGSDELVTGNDLREALDRLESSGQVEQVFGDCWRLRR